MSIKGIILDNKITQIVKTDLSLNNKEDIFKLAVPEIEKINIINQNINSIENTKF